MNVQNKKIFTGLLGLLSASALLVGSVQAGDRGDVPGYVTDSSGEIWRDSLGDCWHGSDWTPADATVVGCDGVVLDAPVEVILGQGTGVVADVTIPAASMFGFDKSELNEEGKASIDEYIATLRPELMEAYLVLVVGHTDTSGDESYNVALSLKRAESVADYLVSQGVSEDALRVIGRGSKELLASEKTREGRMQNRRVDILVVAEVRALDTMLFPSVALFERRSGDLSEQGKVLLEEQRMDARQMLSRSSFIEIVGH
ncbi:MAG: OmpA family protein, partial [Gammaproteobacteria bacterium]|nr:OmpA family protein [Gammaproteobacteria bacterium]